MPANAFISYDDCDQAQAAGFEKNNPNIPTMLRISGNDQAHSTIFGRPAEIELHEYRHRLIERHTAPRRTDRIAFDAIPWPQHGPASTPTQQST